MLKLQVAERKMRSMLKYLVESEAEVGRMVRVKLKWGRMVRVKLKWGRMVKREAEMG